MSIAPNSVQNVGANGVGAIVTDSSEGRFTLLERTLEQFQENLRHLGVIATDFTAKSQDPLNQKVHTMISGLQELDHIKDQFLDVKIPIKLLNILDQGRNPQLYTCELLKETKELNKRVNGKTEMYKKFQACLLQEMSREMPQDVQEFLKIRKIPGLNLPFDQNGEAADGDDALTGD